MDKTAIKNFSIWARNKLIADITYKAGLLGITESEIKDALPQSTKDAEFYNIGTKEPYSIHGNEIKQRKELVAAIKRKAMQLDYKDAYRNVVEEVAYTWFNRLIAIRFMEINDYMPSHIRVLSSEGEKKLEPDLVTTPFDAEIDFTTEETEKIMQMKNDNQVDELFRFLFIRQCNALNAYLPKLFEKTSDYTELLLNVSVTDQDGIVYHLTHDIKEDDFNISNAGEDGKPTGQVEIIGWMYQYYNTEPKDEAFALLKSNVKITKERIPAATQLFTPDWIVRYMVENSVGRLWLEGHDNEALKKEWKYYLDEAEQEPDVIKQLKIIRDEYKDIKPEDIKVIDPCMGSGHILVYAFDVLMKIYESYGYSQRDAAKSIVENNIFGLDIDDRAFQLAYFAIMMKARSYNRRFLTMEIEPNLCAIQESNGLQYDKDMGDFLLSEEHRETLQYLLHTFKDAKEYGSILEVENRDYDGFLRAWELTAEQTAGNVVMLLWYSESNKVVPTLAKQAKILSKKYEAVITNPPYMALGNASGKLNEYIKNYYSDVKADLYGIFIKRCSELVKANCFQAMITQHGWMFLSSFEKLRVYLEHKNLVSCVHLGARAFEEIAGEVVQTASFIYRKNEINNYKECYVRVVDENTQKKKEEKFLLCPEKYFLKKEDFKCIPGNPIIYWVEEKLLESFSNKTINQLGMTAQGLITGNTSQFTRLWFEVDYEKIGFNKKTADEAKKSLKKWFPYNKGGSFRKWYGNNDYVVNWENDGFEIKNFKDEKGKLRSRPQGADYYFREVITWTKISSSTTAFRFKESGHISSEAGMCIIVPEKIEKYVLGFCNSNIGAKLLNALSPTLNFELGDVGKLPIIIDEEQIQRITELVDDCIRLEKEEWDSYELSWDFQINPIVKHINTNLEQAYIEWSNISEKRYNQLLLNEQEINTIFCQIYGVSVDCYSIIDEKNITMRRANRKEDIKALLSYIVGCLFGRYSFEKKQAIYRTECENDNIWIDNDNILLITDEEYLDDDIVNKICLWIKNVCGKDKYIENIQFIADSLDVKGNSPIEIIRNYMINSFYANHCSAYSVASSGKRPVYWLFDSGKNNGFKALIYMHRYNANTIGNLRVDYLHKMERIYENEINRMQDTIENSNNAREVTAASKRKEKLQKQLKECQEYDEKIGHLALSRIEIDLDDGVKVNYEKVQTANDGKKYQVLAKI